MANIREEFEAWAGHYNWDIKRFAESDEYSSDDTDDAWRVWQAAYAGAQQSLRAENEALRDALLWVLWTHQGGSSPVGQRIRPVLGIGQYDRLTADQIARARRFVAASSADDYMDAPITESEREAIARKHRKAASGGEGVR